MNPNHLAIQVNQRPTGVAWFHLRSRLDHSFIAGNRAEDVSESNHRPAVGIEEPRMTDSDTRLVGNDVAGVTHFSKGQIPSRLDLQHRHVDTRVCPQTSGLKSSTVGQQHGVFSIGANRMACGQHMPLLTDDHSTENRAAVVDRDDRRHDFFDRFVDLGLKLIDIEFVRVSSLVKNT